MDCNRKPTKYIFSFDKAAFEVSSLFWIVGVLIVYSLIKDAHENLLHQTT